MIMDHLVKAEHAVSQGERHLEHQRGIIERLKEGGHDTREAEKILRTFEDAQALHRADLERIREELRRAK